MQKCTKIIGMEICCATQIASHTMYVKRVEVCTNIEKKMSRPTAIQWILLKRNHEIFVK